MAFAPPIQLRLDPEKLASYQAAAADRNLSLSDYLRDRLDDPERLAKETARLGAAIEDIRARLEQAPKSAGSDPVVISMLYEVLLYLRKRENPQDRQMIRAEVERVGLKVFGSTK